MLDAESPLPFLLHCMFQGGRDGSFHVMVLSQHSISSGGLETQMHTFISGSFLVPQGLNSDHLATQQLLFFDPLGQLIVPVS